MTNPAVIVNAQGAPTSFNGPAGVDVFRMRVMLSAAKLLSKGIRPNRAYTKTNVMAAISQYTGRKYKRTELDKAIADMQQALTAREQVLVQEGQVVNA